jgi:hypothetical protein
MFRLNSVLFSLAASFVGEYAPFQGVTLSPHAGGVVVMASDRGAGAFYGFDPTGFAPEAATFIPAKGLATACKGIKTAQRELTIDDSIALVTTYYKEHSTSKEFQVNRAAEQLPSRQVIRATVDLWGDPPNLSPTAGRYDSALVTRACKILAEESDSLVLCGYDGGPLRVQSEALRSVVLLMPQAAQELPPFPAWLADYAICA